MKNTYFLLAALFISVSLNAQIIDIPDANFKAALIDRGVDTNNDGEIQVSEAEVVISLNLRGANEESRFSSIEGIEAFSNLEVLIISNNHVSSLDISTLTNLTFIDCYYNELTTLDVSTLTNLTSLNCGLNQLTSLDVTGLTNLISLECHHNDLTSLIISSLPNLTSFNCGYNQLSTLDLSALPNLTDLDCSHNLFPTLDVSTLTNLTSLDCNENQLTALDVSTLTNLTSFDCETNQITALDVSALTNLYLLNCSDNQLTELEVSTLTEMELLVCSNNQLTTLDVSTLTNLRRLWFDFNNISNIDLTNNVAINWLYCSNNQLTNLDISTLNVIQRLFCNNNQLTELDISNAGSLPHLDCSDNQLVSMNLKNGFLTTQYIDGPYEFVLDFNNNPDLSHVCVDDGRFTYDEISELNGVQNLVDSYGYTNCVINSYCSFVPGGTFYTIEGTTHLDLNANGCDVSDGTFSHLNFSITDGTVTGSFISAGSGVYSIPVQEGTHTITPTFESSSYFTVTPTSITVSFPTDTSPYMQDFCITPNGTHHDLEITLLPTQAARPGFDTYYKLKYKNKGTTTLSGTIDLNFMDAIMDFVSASPTEDSQSTDLLSWNFSDLTPFESREIMLIMNINAPTDTPSVNDGDILEFTATLNTSETDETPDDNMSTLTQTVVNSLDPNDKTCLEGNVITPEMVGKYVHYMIRFENTGSADAINIVVKDDIDITKYDLSTLIPIDASHDFVANIKDEGSSHYVEFIFENINLPFDDANNDGYIAFKIKTLNSLQLGDTFENDAEIYFDFNFPIVTNNEQTTVATLSVADFELAQNSISLYPNPTTNLLHINAQQNIQQVNIYDVSGRLIKNIAIIGTKTQVEIPTESLASGTYFVKIKSENGTVVKKVIKG